MSHAEKCPVCGGRGRTETVEDHGTIVRKSQPCHGCDGKGWVEVGNDSIPVPYPVPVSTPPPWQPVSYKPERPLITYFYFHDRGL